MWRRLLCAPHPEIFGFAVNARAFDKVYKKTCFLLKILMNEKRL